MNDSFERNLNKDDRDLIHVESPKSQKVTKRVKKKNTRSNHLQIGFTTEEVQQIRVLAIIEQRTVTDVVRDYVFSGKKMPSYEIKKAS